MAFRTLRLPGGEVPVGKAGSFPYAIADELVFYAVGAILRFLNQSLLRFDHHK